jgi:hypothetical protein
VDAAFEAWVIAPTLKDSPLAKEASGPWLENSASGHGCSPLSVRFGELLVIWVPGRALLVAPPAQAGPAWESLLDFAYHEGELRKIEADIRSAWPGVEQDTPLAYDAQKRDLERDAQIAQRARNVLALRTRLARLEPHLDSTPPRFGPLAVQLAEALREKARCEERLQYADAQIEVQESVYEMASQRLGEFRNARSTFVTEAVIIVLLAAEVLLMLWDALRH